MKWYVSIQGTEWGPFDTHDEAYSFAESFIGSSDIYQRP